MVPSFIALGALLGLSAAQRLSGKRFGVETESNQNNSRSAASMQSRQDTGHREALNQIHRFTQEALSSPQSEAA